MALARVVVVHCGDEKIHYWTLANASQRTGHDKDFFKMGPFLLVSQGKTSARRRWRGSQAHYFDVGSVEISQVLDPDSTDDDGFDAWFRLTVTDIPLVGCSMETLDAVGRAN